MVKEEKAEKFFFILCEPLLSFVVNCWKESVERKTKK